jgi:hypothetical protein
MATTVTFDGNDAEVTVTSDTELTAVVPAGTAGAVDVVVTTSTGEVTVTDGYTYEAPSPPVLTDVVPGTIRPGAPALVFGTGSTTWAGVAHVGTADVTLSSAIPRLGGFTLGNTTTNSLTVGSTYDISFTDTDGVDSNTLVGALEVVDEATLPAPSTITAVTPATAAFGDTVTLTGTGFIEGDTAVLLSSSANQQTYVIPASTSDTEVTFVVPDGTGTSGNRVYTYTPSGAADVSALPTYPLQVAAS